MIKSSLIASAIIPGLGSSQQIDLTYLNHLQFMPFLLYDENFALCW